MYFTKESFKYPVSNDAVNIFNETWDCLAMSGSWWSGEERVAIAMAARESIPRELFDQPRASVSELSCIRDSESLSPLVIDVIERIVTESGSLDKFWCASVCERIGEGAYVELVAVIILVLPIDRFCLYLGRDLAPLPIPNVATTPLCQYPNDLIDVGAWVRQTQSAVDDPELVNVSRALSMSPNENRLRREMVDALYMEGHSFFDSIWDKKTLSRPQLELAATRTSVINECFYCAQGHTSILDIASKALGENASLESTQGKVGDDIGVPHGELILAFTEIANRTPQEAHHHLPLLIDSLGVKGAVELASVVAIFNGLNRTSDPTGVPLEKSLMAYGRIDNKIRKLGLDKLNGINSSKSVGLLESVGVLVMFKIKRYFGGRQ